MITQQLLDYINQNIKLGKTHEQITTELINGGWKDEAIKQAFASILNGAPAPASMELPPAQTILKESWEIYKARFKTLIIINLIPLAIIAIFGLIGGFGALSGRLLNFNFGGYGLIVTIIYVLIAAISLIYISLWGAVAQIYAIKDHAEQIEWMEAFKRSQKKITAFFGTNLLVGLITFAGIILLIVPGIIFGLWFSQASFLVIEEDLAGTMALKRSKALVKGRLGTMFGKFFYIGLITILLYILISIIALFGISSLGSNSPIPSIFSNLFSLFWTPLTLVYSFQLFKHLKRTRT